MQQLWEPAHAECACACTQRRQRMCNTVCNIQPRHCICLPFVTRREEIELKFDRPFVFAVVHGPTGLALFAGEVYKPEAWTA